MDIYSTSLALAGATLEEDRIVDGYDLTESLKGNAKSPRDVVYYYRGTRLMALRTGPWKAHFATQESYTGNNKVNEHDPPVLYNLEVDPSEKWNVADRHPDVIAEIKAAAESHKATVVAVPSQLEIPLPR